MNGCRRSLHPLVERADRVDVARRVAGGIDPLPQHPLLVVDLRDTFVGVVLPFAQLDEDIIQTRALDHDGLHSRHSRTCLDHSMRFSAAIGSTRVARHAGTKHAAAHTAASTTATAKNAAGLFASTRYSVPAMTRLTARASSTPEASPPPPTGRV